MKIKGNAEIKYLQWAYFLLIGVLVTPKVPLFGVDSANTLFRLDTFVSIIFSMVSIFWIIKRKAKIFLALIALFFLYAGFFNDNGEGFEKIISAGYATLFFGSLVVAKEIGVLSSEIYIKNKKYIEIIYGILFVNAAIAITSRLTGYNLCRDVEYGGFESTRCIIDEYGLTGAPYIFGAYSIALIVISNRLIRLKALIVGFSTLILSDSRAFAASFIPLISYLFLKEKRLGVWRVIVLTAGLLIIPFIDTKTISGFQGEQLTDQSFMMRLMIYEDFMNWLDLSKLIIGGGANAFLEFSVQYDMPGHPDNLYIRIISEVGVVGFLLLFFVMVAKSKYANGKKSIEFLLFIFGIGVLGLAQESLFAVKSGHILAFVLGYLQSQKHKHQSKISVDK